MEIPCGVICVPMHSVSTPATRGAVCSGIFGINVGGDVDMGAIGALHQIQQHGAVARARDLRQIIHVFGAARCNTVGKFGQGGRTAQRDGFHLDESIRQAFLAQQKIHARVLAVFHFWPHGRVGAQRLDLARLKCGAQHAVG